MELPGIAKANTPCEGDFKPFCSSSLENSRTAIAVLERQSLRVRWGNRRFWELADDRLVNALKDKRAEKGQDLEGGWSDLLEAVQGAAQAWPPYRCKGRYPLNSGSGKSQSAPFIVSVASRQDGPADILVEMLEPEEAPAPSCSTQRFIRLQQGVCRALTMLLSGQPIKAALQEALQTMGEAADVERAFFIQYSQATKDWDWPTYLEWARDSHMAGEEAFQQSCLSAKLRRGVDLLLSGQPLHDPIPTCSDEDRLPVEGAGAGLLLAVPVILEGALGAVIGFYDCRRHQEWGESERALLSMLAGGMRAVRSAARVPRPLEEALYNTEERLALAMSSSQGGYWETFCTNSNPILFADKCYMSAGQKCIIGYDETEFPDSAVAWFGQILPDDIPPIYSAIEQHYQERSRFFEAEYRIHHRDGSLRWVAMRGKVLVDDEGNAHKCSGIVWDITERKAAEQEREQLLHERERQRECLEKLIDHAPVGIAAVQGADHHVVLANPMFCRVTNNQQVLHRPLADVVTPMPDTLCLMLKEVRATGMPASLNEYGAKDPNGNSLCWNIQIVPLHEVEGAIDTVLIILLDMTEQVSARKRLAEMAKSAESNFLQLEAVINSMTEGLIICSAEGWIVHMNPAAHFINGFTKEDAPVTLEDLRSRLDLYDMNDAPLPCEEWPLAHVLQGLQFTDRALRVVRKDTGREWIGSYSGTPIPDEHGRVAMAVLTVRDVTQAKQHERQLQDWNEALEQRIGERTKSLLKYQSQLRDLATELSRAEQRERRHLATELHDYLAQLLVASKMKLGQASGIVRSKLAGRYLCEADQFLNNCLSYTRTLIAELSPSVLYEAGLGAAIKWLAEQMIQHELSVEVIEDSEIIDVPDDHAILIFQSVRELLFNVMKHAGVKTAFIMMTCDEERILISVEDHGKGFNSQEETKMPGKYGLFSIQERLEAIGACLSVESTAGAGTCASIILPLCALSGARTQGDLVSAPSVVTGDVKSPARLIRVLVADDHSIIRSGLRTLLDSYTDLHVIGEASNGQEAVELAQKLRPDVIIMDVNMPKMNGIQATRIIKRECPAIAVLGLSVFNDSQIEKSMLDAGAFAMLSKGGPPEDLCQSLRSTRPAT